MNEIDKMRNSQLADMEKPEIQDSFIHAKKLDVYKRQGYIYRKKLSILLLTSLIEHQNG